MNGDIKMPFEAKTEDLKNLRRDTSASEVSSAGFGKAVPEVKTGYQPAFSATAAKMSADSPIVPRVAKENSSDKIPETMTNAEYYEKLGRTAR